MKVVEHINQADKTLFSFEILPPKKGQKIDGVFETVEALLPFQPKFIDVTSHATDVLYKEMGDGLLKRVPVRKRPGTISVCAAVKFKYQIDTVPHLICSGFTKEETEDGLLDLSFLGIENVMALRGDPSHGDRRFVPQPEGNQTSLELVEQVMGLNQGRFLHSEELDPNPTDFCIGVAGYPEKHMDAPNEKADLSWLKKKADAGAEFIVTQMFFDNQVFFRFVDRCREEGIDIPIIPGLKPVTTLKQLSILPNTFRIDLPDALVEAVQAAGSSEAVKRVGIEWTIEQSRELMAKGVPVLHYYTMSKSSGIRQIAEAVFGSR